MGQEGIHICTNDYEMVVNIYLKLDTSIYSNTDIHNYVCFSISKSGCRDREDRWLDGTKVWLLAVWMLREENRAGLLEILT
jgi:hypothetical protein